MSYDCGGVALMRRSRPNEAMLVIYRWSEYWRAAILTIQVFRRLMLLLIGLVGPAVRHMMAGDAMLDRAVGPVPHVGHFALVLRHYRAGQGHGGA